jgi:hypothetical protein
MNHAVYPTAGQRTGAVRAWNDRHCPHRRPIVEAFACFASIERIPEFDDAVDAGGGEPEHAVLRRKAIPTQAVHGSEII